MKRCVGCKKTKALDEFYRNWSAKDLRTTRCKDCLKAARKAYYQKNKDKERAYRQVYNSLPRVKRMRREYGRRKQDDKK